jgi:hypothetical protein
MNTFGRSWALAMSFFVVGGCATPKKAQETPLQLQAFQAREFETNKTTAFGSVLSVFQDLGYIVASADKETGFITASSPAGLKTNFWEALGGIQTSGQTKATAFVEEIRPGFVTVRLNFVDARKKSSMYGQSQELDKPILDPKPYEVAFARIGDAVFIRTGNK